MDDYTNLKKNVAEYQKKKKKKKDLTYSADDNQFKLDCINNFFNSVSNSKITKNSFKNVLKNDIVNKKQNIIKTNPRGQANEKKTVLDIYKHFAKVFAPLLEWHNEQFGLETQAPYDEQPDITDMP